MVSILGVMVGIKMKNKIKISELFYSIQGEGRYMGVPSVFLRTFGCNFTCDGFGMPKGEKSNERHIVASNAKGYKQYRDLPLVNTGCDSYASWDPRFKHLSPFLTTDSIAEAIVETLPFKEWRDEHLVITGGEPLLGWQKSYPALLAHPLMRGLKEITFETNGSQKLHQELVDYLNLWQWAMPGRQVTFSVSTKLSVSGEPRKKTVKPDVIPNPALSVSGCPTAPVDGFFTAAPYRGAFSSNPGQNWLSDWTYSQVLGHIQGISACPTDLDSDGDTDVDDFLIFAPAFGTTCN